MKPEELKLRLRGVLAFATTPFDDQEDLDVGAFAANVEQLAANDVGAVVICGAVGEFFSLTEEEWRTLVAAAVDVVDPSIPLLAGVGNGVRTACRMAEYAADLGVAGLMVNPYPLPQLSPEGLASYYRALYDSSGLGLMAFSRANAIYGPATLEALSEIEGVIALKDEYGDLQLFSESVSRFGDRFAWINGMAELLAGPYFVAGAQAFTSGIVNFAPRLVREVWDLGETGRWEDLNRLVATNIAPIAELRARRPGNDVTVIKAALGLLGGFEGTVRPPHAPLHQADRKELEKVMTRMTSFAASP